jgi:hypothetical protein
MRFECSAFIISLPCEPMNVPSGTSRSSPARNPISQAQRNSALRGSAPPQRAPSDECQTHLWDGTNKRERSTAPAGQGLTFSSDFGTFPSCGCPPLTAVVALRRTSRTRHPVSHLFSTKSPGQFARTRDKRNRGAEMPYAKTTRSLFGWRSARSFCLAVVFSTMAAAQNNAPSGNEGTTFAAWDAFAGQLRSLGD